MVSCTIVSSALKRKTETETPESEPLLLLPCTSVSQSQVGTTTDAANNAANNAAPVQRTKPGQCAAAGGAGGAGAGGAGGSNLDKPTITDVDVLSDRGLVELAMLQFPKDAQLQRAGRSCLRVM